MAGRIGGANVGFMLGLLLDAALIGIIIAVMERGEFPGWGIAIGCAFAIGITSNVVSMLLPGVLSLLGVVAGAVVGAFVISWLCEMTFRRSVQAAGIYLAVSFVFSLIFGLVAGF